MAQRQREGDKGAVRATRKRGLKKKGRMEGEREGGREGAASNTAANPRGVCKSRRSCWWETKILDCMMSATRPGQGLLEAPPAKITEELMASLVMMFSRRLGPFRNRPEFVVH